MTYHQQATTPTKTSTLRRLTTLLLTAAAGAGAIAFVTRLRR